MAEIASPPRVTFEVFFDGMLAALRSVFFYVLISNYGALGALAHGLGFSVWWMTAAPAQVLLISYVFGG